MRSKLNPNGGKIRTLRIQRGWTQEQLAEIAGVSTRTVQRAESANCAAFETLRAIAGAFDTEFNQLLKPEASAPDPAIAPGSSLELEPVAAVELPKPAAGRTWTMLWVAVSTLVVGLVGGAILMPRLGMREESAPTASPFISVRSPQGGASQRSAPPAMVSRQVQPVKRAPSTVTRVSIPDKTADGSESLQNLRSVEHPAKISLTADLAAHDIIQRHRTLPSLDAVQSQSLFLAPEISEVPVAWSDLTLPSGDSTPDQQDLGAVREAMDLAAKKTGTFVSKVRTSIKRVF
jgi:transcriptional regulator with XRE-family HTH domain